MDWAASKLSLFPTRPLVLVIACTHPTLWLGVHAMPSKHIYTILNKRRLKRACTYKASEPCNMQRAWNSEKGYSRQLSFRYRSFSETQKLCAVTG